MTDTYVVSATGKPVITKDPDANLDYTFDWSEWLAPIDDTILSGNATISTIAGDLLPANITQQAVTGNSTGVTAWVDGGTVGNQYTVDCHIETVEGRQDDRRIYITIKDR